MDIVTFQHCFNKHDVDDNFYPNGFRTNAENEKVSIVRNIRSDLRIFDIGIMCDSCHFPRKDKTFKSKGESDQNLEGKTPQL
ncbi:unnamed protein product, partial [Mesorhabditis belari]|uniref:Uncharacterized protein n=1 Tax=Mesorhabditis belari TaxID=2138241 RepID=A0AAF3F6Q4_9BILA